MCVLRLMAMVTTSKKQRESGETVERLETRGTRMRHSFNGFDVVQT